MRINISNLTPASTKAKNVATETYVDVKTEEVASSLGYRTYDELKSAALSGDTVINGGYINTNLIDTDALVIGDSSDGLYLDKDVLKVKVNGVTRVQLGNLSV